MNPILMIFRPSIPAMTNRVRTHTLSYRGYTGIVMRDAKLRTYVGRVDGIEDDVTFEVSTPGRLSRIFEKAIDDYLNACARIGREPITAS